MRALTDALMLYALHMLGAASWLLVVLFFVIAIAAYLELRARFIEDE